MKLLLVMCLALGTASAHVYFRREANADSRVQRNVLEEFKEFGAAALEKMKDELLAELQKLPTNLLGKGLKKRAAAAVKKLEAPKKTKLTQLVTEEAAKALETVQEAVKDAETMAEGLQQHLQEAAGSLLGGVDITQLAQKVVAFLTDCLHNMENKGTYEIDVDKLFENVIPNAINKLAPKLHRRFLLTDVVNGVGTVLKDVFGLAGQAVGGVQSLLTSLLNGTATSIQPHVDNIKALATNFLQQAGSVSAQAATNAVAFFQPYAQQLGPLYTQIVALAGKLTPGSSGLYTEPTLG